MRWMTRQGKPARPYEPGEQGEGKLEPKLVRQSGEDERRQRAERRVSRRGEAGPGRRLRHVIDTHLNPRLLK